MGICGTKSSSRSPSISELSPVAPLTLRPVSAPVRLTAVAGNQQATISFFQPKDESIIGFTVVSNGDMITSVGGSSPIVVPDLVNGQSYQFFVIAHTLNASSSESSPSSIVIPLSPPSAPTNVIAVAGDGQARVTFTCPPYGDGIAPFDKFVVTVTPSELTLFTNATSVVIPHLTNGIAYTFRVKVSGYNDAVSLPSAPVTPWAPPAAPTNVLAAPGDGHAIVSFTPAAYMPGVAPITGYTVTSDPGNLTAHGLASPIVLNGLINGTTYSVRVSVQSAIGSSDSITSAVVTPQAPPAINAELQPPTQVEAIAGDRCASVVFDASHLLPLAKEFEVRLYRAPVAHDAQYMSTHRTKHTTFLHKQLNNGRPYYFTVRARLHHGEVTVESEPSNSHSIFICSKSGTKGSCTGLV